MVITNVGFAPNCFIICTKFLSVILNFAFVSNAIMASPDMENSVFTEIRNDQVNNNLYFLF